MDPEPQRIGLRSIRHHGWRVFAIIASLALIGTACSKSASAEPQTPLTKVSVQNFRYHGMPATLSAGLHQFLFQNDESFPITHEMIPVALPSGKTAQDITADAKANGPASEDNWLHIGGDFGDVATGAGVVETLYLPPGNYAIACWQTGTAQGGDNGPPHVAIGMVFGFKVT